MSNSQEVPSAIHSIIDGYQKFKTKYYVESNAFEGLVRNGQQPKILIIGCCDSRADPAILTCCDPGDLFIVRNVANLVPPFHADKLHHSTSSALEFGVNVLGITDIVVLGHSYCGGIRALMEGKSNSKANDFIGTWISIAKPAKDRVLEKYPKCSIDEQSHHCEKESLSISLENLQTFPWIRKCVEKGQLYLHSWYFDLESGNIEVLDKETGNFSLLSNDSARS